MFYAGHRPTQIHMDRYIERLISDIGDVYVQSHNYLLFSYSNKQNEKRQLLFNKNRHKVTSKFSKFEEIAEKIARTFINDK